MGRAAEPLPSRDRAITDWLAALNATSPDGVDMFVALPVPGESTGRELAQLVLRESPRRVRIHAARALGELAIVPDAAIPALCAALADAEPLVRAYAVAGLVRYGPPAQSAVWAAAHDLRKVPFARQGDGTEIRSRLVSDYALAALSQIAPLDPRPLLEEYRKSLTQGVSTENTLSTPELSLMIESAFTGAAPSMPSLLEYLGDSSPNVRALAVRCLGRVAHPEIALPELRRRLTTQDEELRSSVLEALCACGPTALADLLTPYVELTAVANGRTEPEWIKKVPDSVRSRLDHCRKRISELLAKASTGDLIDLLRTAPSEAARKEILSCLGDSDHMWQDFDLSDLLARQPDSWGFSPEDLPPWWLNPGIQSPALVAYYQKRAQGSDEETRIRANWALAFLGQPASGMIDELRAGSLTKGDDFMNALRRLETYYTDPKFPTLGVTLDRLERGILENNDAAWENGCALPVFWALVGRSKQPADLARQIGAGAAPSSIRAYCCDLVLAASAGEADRGPATVRVAQAESEVRERFDEIFLSRHPDWTGYLRSNVMRIGGSRFKELALSTLVEREDRGRVRLMESLRAAIREERAGFPWVEKIVAALPKGEGSLREALENLLSLSSAGQAELARSDAAELKRRLAVAGGPTDAEFRAAPVLRAIDGLIAQGRGAADSLFVLTHDPDGAIRAAATNAVCRIAPDDDRTRTACLNLLADMDQGVREGALESLGPIVQDSPPLRAIWVAAALRERVIRGAENWIDTNQVERRPMGKFYVADVYGTVRIHRDEQVEDLVKKSAYQATGTTLETETVEVGRPASAELVLSNGTGVRLGENSRLIVRKFAQEAFVPDRTDMDLEPSMSFFRAELERGIVSFASSRLRPDSYTILLTPLAQIEFRGGKLVIESTERETRISLVDGGARVQARGGDAAAQPLQPGQQATVHLEAGKKLSVDIATVPVADRDPLDDAVALAAMAKKTVYFEVRETSTGSAGPIGAPLVLAGAAAGSTTGEGPNSSVGQGMEGLKEFPWPAPAPTFRNEFGAGNPDFDLNWLGGESATLNEVYGRIVASGKKIPGFEHELFAISAVGGFAVVMRREHIDQTGEPVPGPDRWTTDRMPSKSFMGRLLPDTPGYYRIIVFAVVAKQHREGDSENGDGRALPRWKTGSKRTDLPAVLKDRTMSDYIVKTLVYVFKKSPPPLATVEPEGGLSAQEHLEKSGLLTNFKSARK